MRKTVSSMWVFTVLEKMPFNVDKWKNWRGAKQFALERPRLCHVATINKSILISKQKLNAFNCELEINTIKFLFSILNILFFVRERILRLSPRLSNKSHKIIVIYIYDITYINYAKSFLSLYLSLSLSGIDRIQSSNFIVKLHSKNEKRKKKTLHKNSTEKLQKSE